MDYWAEKMALHEKCEKEEPGRKCPGERLCEKCKAFEKAWKLQHGEKE